MKKIVSSALLLGAVFFSTQVDAQIRDEKSVTMTMDLQPVLQLKMETADQLEFVFDDINDYYAGITKYSATTLKISSTVSWDLYAVGRSNGSTGARFWDQQVDYGSGNNLNATPEIPLSALELHQSEANFGDGAATGGLYTDYSAAFGIGGTPIGSNSIFYNNDGSATPPTAANKYIAGHAGTSGTAGQDFIPGGSYLTQNTAPGPAAAASYVYNIDYRILPGLPAVFPMAFEVTGNTQEPDFTAGEYAEPGVYTMYVQYILLEDQ